MPKSILKIMLPALLVFAACQSDERFPFGDQNENGQSARNGKSAAGAPLVQTVERGHNKAAFLRERTVAFDIELTWRGQNTLKANVLQRTDGSRIRLRKSSGTDLLWDGDNAWNCSPETPEPKARFDLFTWHYFFCLPWKLSDPGTRWQPLPDRTLDSRACTVGKLTFESGTGDAPDDWYVIFADKDDGLVRAATYIVTYGGGSVEKAGKTPHMIRYEDYRRVGEVPVAHAWKFYSWNTDSLVPEQMLGSAIIRNVRFADEGPSDFQKSERAAKI